MMSGDAALLPCPICSHTGAFVSVETLRDKLIQVSTNKLTCPVCQDEILGLDKLTIHLFSHVKILPKNCSDGNHKDSKKILTTKLDNHAMAQQKRIKPTVAKNKSAALSATTPVKFVKIFPKLPVISLNTLPVIDISRSTADERSPSGEMFIKTENSLLSINTTCNICGLQFVDANILKMHRALIHNLDEGSNQSCTRYNCHLCPKNFKMRGSLMVHLRVAHYGFLTGNSDPANNSSNDDIDDINTDKLLVDKSQNLERNDNKQWQCDVCRKCFTTKYFLKKHKRLHTGETPYACTQCNKTFTFQQSYHKHLLYHNDEKPHTCSFCGRSFKELSTLHNHQRIHTGEKPFSCETCGKCFRQRVSYLVHRRIHTGVMPYKCTACNKSFRYKVSQRTHKCQSQPPGTVVRQAGDLVEKLKKKYTNNDQISSIIDYKNSPNDSKYPEVSEANAELVRSGAKLSLEDMESEHFTLIADSFGETEEHIYDNPPGTSTNSLPSEHIDTKQFVKISHNIDELIDAIPILDKSVPSPSEILQNLCLSKEEDFKELFHNELNGKDFDIHKDFNDFL